MPAESKEDAFAVAMACLLEKMAEAGWVIRSLSSMTKLEIDWTGEGLSKCRQLNELLWEIGQLTEAERQCLAFVIAEMDGGNDGSASQKD